MYRQWLVAQQAHSFSAPFKSSHVGAGVGELVHTRNAGVVASNASPAWVTPMMCVATNSVYLCIHLYTYTFGITSVLK